LYNIQLLNFFFAKLLSMKHLLIVPTGTKVRDNPKNDTGTAELQCTICVFYSFRSPCVFEPVLNQFAICQGRRLDKGQRYIVLIECFISSLVQGF
jgi:hypothetical protein